MKLTYLWLDPVNMQINPCFNRTVKVKRHLTKFRKKNLHQKNLQDKSEHIMNST